MDPTPPPSLRSRLLTGFAGLLGAFVLYVLSIGPVTYFQVKHASIMVPIPRANYYRPMDWIAKKFPALVPSLNTYEGFWIELALKHRPDLSPETQETPPTPP